MMEMLQLLNSRVKMLLHQRQRRKSPHLIGVLDPNRTTHSPSRLGAKPVKRNQMSWTDEQFDKTSCVLQPCRYAMLCGTLMKYYRHGFRVLEFRV